jgi:hypothetical protein
VLHQGQKLRTRMTDASGLVIFSVRARNLQDVIRFEAKCGSAGLMPLARLTPSKRLKPVTPFTRRGFHLRPTATCAAFGVAPTKLQVGRFARLSVRVRLRGSAVINARVLVRGGGISQSATTGRSGLASFRIVAKRSGVLRVAIPNFTSCGRTIPIDPKHAGKQLTG